MKTQPKVIFEISEKAHIDKEILLMKDTYFIKESKSINKS